MTKNKGKSKEKQGQVKALVLGLGVFAVSVLGMLALPRILHSMSSSGGEDAAK